MNARKRVTPVVFIRFHDECYVSYIVLECLFVTCFLPANVFEVYGSRTVEYSAPTEISTTQNSSEIIFSKMAAFYEIYSA